MVSEKVFRLFELPAELRLRIYDFLGLVYREQPASIYAISTFPEILLKVPRAMRDEMLDIYIGKNRFSITNLLGLRQFLTDEGQPYVSHIRHLRLRHGIEGAVPSGRPTVWRRSSGEELRPKEEIPLRFCEIDIDLHGDEPWFTTRFVHGLYDNQDKANEVLCMLERNLKEIVSRSKAGRGRLDAESLQEIAEYWLHCRRQLQDSS